MSYNVLNASVGVAWLKEAWSIFKRQPFTFIMMHVFIIVVGLLPMLAPVLNIAASLVAPFLTIGFYQAILKVQANNKTQLSDITAPLFAKGQRRAVFHLAMCQVVVALLISLLAQFLFSDMIEVLVNAEENMNVTTLIHDLIGNFDPVNFLMFMAVMIINYAAFAFALPLVFFKNTPLVTAIQQSLKVFFGNMGALSVFGGLVALLMVISIPLQLLPLLVIMPISYIGFFLAFKSIFSYSENTPTKTAQTAPTPDNGRFDA
ncbi:BPSS1780 family membrane protein [Pseudoalteromonas xiamenensis]